jgi:hypothetical protein
MMAACFSPFLSRVPQHHHHVPVFIPCHIEPDMRFALIRLSDNLLLGVFKTSIVPAFSNLPRQVGPLHVCLLALKYSFALEFS